MRNSSKNLEKQLLAYSTAAGAVLAVAPSSDATVVVTNINTTLTYNSSGQVDLLVNSIKRFQISLNVTNYFGGGATPIREAAFNIVPNTDAAFWRRAGNSSVLPLALNAPVQGGNWSRVPYARNMAWAMWQSTFSRIGTAGPFAQNLGVTNYLGLRFLVSGVTNYGWASVLVSPDMQSYTIGRFVYDNTGGNILAGVIPEPNSLSLLALGAAGLFAFRRSRKNAKP
jgi:hypothetical protein